MGKTLYIGDIHATVNDLDECDRFLGYVCQIVKEPGVNRVVFLGDQYHNHEIVRVEVLNFWNKWLDVLGGVCQSVYVLVGNHDQVGRNSILHSLCVHGRSVFVVEKPCKVDGVLLLPHYFSNEEFVKACNDNVANTLVCHQTFSGSKFENGMFAPDGVDPSVLGFKNIISGHIHNPQKFGNVWYPGSPRWRNLSDGLVKERFLHSVEHDSDGGVGTVVSYPTNSICKRIAYFKDTPNEPVSLDEFSNTNCEYRIDIYGSKEYVNNREKELKQFNCKIRVFPDQSKCVLVKESEGIKVSFDKYIESFKPKYGTKTEVLKGMAHERIAVR